MNAAPVSGEIIPSTEHSDRYSLRPVMVSDHRTLSLQTAIDQVTDIFLNFIRSGLSQAEPSTCMSWFSGSKDAAASIAKEANYQPPKREERKHCWEARDNYNACLDRHEIVDPVIYAAVASAKCGRESEAFEKDCASSWVAFTPKPYNVFRFTMLNNYIQVQYFKQKRVADFQKAEKYKKLEEEGAIPAGQGAKWKPW